MCGESFSEPMPALPEKQHLTEAVVKHGVRMLDEYYRSKPAIDVLNTFSMERL